MPLAARIGRGRTKLADQGAKATAAHAVHLLRRRLYLHEQHIWYDLDLENDITDRALPEGVTLTRAAPSDVPRVAELGQNIDDAKAYLAEGHDLWITVEGDVLLFACWVFRGRTPVMAAPSGKLALPPGTVCLEDSFTAAAARGRGIAPASWCAVAHQMRDEGARHMITKVEVVNVPSRKAVAKSGFREIGMMEFSG